MWLGQIPTFEGNAAQRKAAYDDWALSWPLAPFKLLHPDAEILTHQSQRRFDNISEELPKCRVARIKDQRVTWQGNHVEQNDSAEAIVVLRNGQEFVRVTFVFHFSSPVSCLMAPTYPRGSVGQNYKSTNPNTDAFSREQIFTTIW